MPVLPTLSGLIWVHWDNLFVEVTVEEADENR
jgi:hypothetical protein